jgi:nucleoid-associated protein YgaU
MSEKKGIFGGLFGKKEEEKKPSPKRPAHSTDIDKAKADMLLKQKENREEAKKVVKYTVASGDTLSAIAQKYYDDAGAYMKIYEANKDVIGDNPDLIQPGMELVIPKK